MAATNETQQRLIDIAAHGEPGRTANAITSLLCPPEAVNVAASRYAVAFRQAWFNRKDDLTEQTVWEATQRWVTARTLVALDPDTPGSWLREWANKNDLRVLRSIASNPSCPPDLLGVFALSDDYRHGELKVVSLLAVLNRSCPGDVLSEVIFDEHDYNSKILQEIALVHPNCPPRVRVLFTCREQRSA